LMLDCSRCFLHVDYIKRYIDLMARYKLNVLHLHLTDDQGWRPFIEAYPDLTRIGSLHASNQNTEGGYYSKAEMREIVEYAASRYITVVPEIESPGHSMAALAAYPWLGCVGEGYEVPYRISVFPDVLCPGKESTYRFLEDVWTEILEIFPSEVVHLGGDEVPKIRWMECADCQAAMEREGLETPEELQSYFVGRVVDMLAEKGRRAIGWDEILEGGLAEGALVMSWRGTEGGIAAAEMGHDVVMSPTTYCYFDYPVNVTDLAKTYSYDPTPAELAPAEARHILGVQANMWTHLVPQSGIDHQIFPRLLALAEIGWSPAERDYPDFRARVDEHLPWLESLGVDAGYPTFPALDSSREPAWTRPARIETTIETYMDYRPIRAFDGDTRDSFFWSARGLVEGDHFTLVLEEPMALRHLRVLTAHPPSGHSRDVLLDGVLEISGDGERFEEVARFAGEGAEADLGGQRVTAVRIRCLADQIEWLIIREIELTPQSE
ncbi:MAG: family 20 glycosylhydrolase, partial [Armatimonadia bacterium]|nr:family 20 glycosylhydrolase [Armatimonadia bacterium]